MNVVCNERGLQQMWSERVCNECGLLWTWSVMNVVCYEHHECGLLRMWSVMDVVCCKRGMYW